MRCQEAKQFIHSYLDGQLADPQQKMLYQHLSLCPSCQEEMNVARRVNELLEENCAPIEAPVNFTSMVMQQIPGAPVLEECPPVKQRKRKRAKKGTLVSGWLSSMLDMETRVLLAASYFVIFIAIGVLFVYGSNQLNTLTPAQQGGKLPLAGDLTKQEEPKQESPDNEQNVQQAEREQQNVPAKNTVAVAPARPDQQQGGGLTISEDIDVEVVSPTVILTQVVTDTQLNNIHPVWSKDGKVLYLSQYKDGGQRYAVWQASADGKESKPVAAGQYGLPVMEGGGIWSPDRAEIAYVTKRNGYLEIWSDDLNGRGTNLTIDTTGKALERANSGEDLWAYNPVWSSTGELAYLTTRSGNVDIMAIDVNGINRVVTMTPAVEKNAAWSPDGQQIAYFRSMTEEESGTTNQIYVVNKDGSNPQAVTGNFAAAAMTPAWHPEGKMLAVNAGQVERRSREDKGIWLVDTDSGSSTQITKIGGGGLISWSPDGTKLAFTDENGVLYVLYVEADYSVDKIYRIMPDTEGQSRVWVDWAEDSQRLLFDWDKVGTAQGIWMATLPDLSNDQKVEGPPASPQVREQ